MEALHMEQFIAGYLNAMLWSSCDETGDPLDQDRGIEDIHADDVDSLTDLCATFARDNLDDLNAYVASPQIQAEEGHSPWGKAGHDLWLTSQGHGVGFWDRGLGELGDRLTTASKASDYADICPYVADDGTVRI